jgi:hypothetical protein
MLDENFGDPRVCDDRNTELRDQERNSDVDTELVDLHMCCDDVKTEPPHESQADNSYDTECTGLFSQPPVHYLTKPEPCDQTSDGTSNHSDQETCDEMGNPGVTIVGDDNMGVEAIKTEIVSTLVVSIYYKRYLNS